MSSERLMSCRDKQSLNTSVKTLELPSNPITYSCHKFIWLNLLPVLAFAIGLALSSLLPEGPSFHADNHGYIDNPNAISMFFDGRWYNDIALNGYRWDAVNGTLTAHYQNVAFFPLYPLIERAFTITFGTRSEYAFSLLSIAFGFLSNLAFCRFASRLLPERLAFWASAFFICWPAACFLWMGYPTGLLNICAIYCMQNYIVGRRFTAALWSGLGTATAPSMIFIATGLCLHFASEWLPGKRSLLELYKLAAFGLLSVSGLISFMLYLFFKFHDPFVFIEAQSAWSTPEKFVNHLELFTSLRWYLKLFNLSVFSINGVLHYHFLQSTFGRIIVNQTFQYILSFSAVCLGVVIILKTFRRFPSELSFSGILVVIGYLWFMVSTPTYFWNGIRMCYPALAIFLGLARLMENKKVLPFTLLSVFLILMTIETALIKAGYSVM